MRALAVVMRWPSAVAALSSANWVSFSTEVNCAVWARNWSGSDGLSGSWYLSWVTISFRNMSLSMSFFALASVDFFVLSVTPTWLGEVALETEGIRAPGGDRRSVGD